MNDRVKNETKKEGFVCFSVTSNAESCEKWIDRLKSKGVHIPALVKDTLRAPGFNSTKGELEVVIIDGDRFPPQERTSKKIREEAKNHEFIVPKAEVACLIREKFTDDEIEAMGFECIIIMHKPIRLGMDVYLLGVGRFGEGNWLVAGQHEPYYNPDHYGWGERGGFAFLRS